MEINMSDTTLAVFDAILDTAQDDYDLFIRATINGQKGTQEERVKYVLDYAENGMGLDISNKEAEFISSLANEFLDRVEKDGCVESNDQFHDFQVKLEEYED
jgi:hypothetical protein